MFGSRAQAECVGEIEGRGRTQWLAFRDEHEREIVRRRVGQLAQPLSLFVALDVVPPVRHVISGQERLDVVTAVGPPVTDHAHVRCVVGVGLPPVVEQAIDDGVQPFLGRIPRLEQVVVEADVVDRLDGNVRVRVCRQQQELRARVMGPCLLEHLDARHLRHPLVGGDQRHRLVPQRELGQHAQCLSPRRRAHDAVAGTVAAAQVPSDCRGHHGVVVDGQDDGFAHQISFRAASSPV